MAVLSSKTTSGVPSWDKYVKLNNNYDQITFSIENKMNASMFDLSGKTLLFDLKEKEQFKIVSQNTYSIEKTLYAKVSYNNAIGLIALNKIRKPTTTDVLKEEATTLKNLDDQIKTIVSKKGPFNLIIKNDPNKTIYKDIIGARNVSEKVLGREAKSDFNIISKTGDSIFISHKKAGGADAFQQYGGVSLQAGEKIYYHSEVSCFLEKLPFYIENDRLKHPVYSKIIDRNLINMAVYGHDFGLHFGIDNVSIIGQGDAVINEHADFFMLDFSCHLVHNGNAEEFANGPYQAVLGATFRSGRGFSIGNKRYLGARVGIYPAKLITNRKYAKEI